MPTIYNIDFYILPLLNKYLHLKALHLIFLLNCEFSLYFSLFFAPPFHLLSHKDEIDASFQSQ